MPQTGAKGSTLLQVFEVYFTSYETGETTFDGCALADRLGEEDQHEKQVADNNMGKSTKTKHKHTCATLPSLQSVQKQSLIINH